jgi:hypothetical protein
MVSPPSPLSGINRVVSKSADTYDFENVLSYNSSGFVVEFGPVGGNYSTESLLASSGSFSISPSANSVATGQPTVETSTSTGGSSTPTTTGTPLPLELFLTVLGSGSESSASGSAAASGAAAASGSGSASSGSSTASAAAKSGAQSQFGTRGVAIAVGLVAAGITGAFALF